MAKDIQIQAFKTKKSIDELVNSSGGGQISDNDELTAIVKDVCLANMDVVEKIKAGKTYENIGTNRK